MATDNLETIVQRLSALTADIRSIRTDLAIGFRRMAEMQAELDLLPTARRRREVVLRRQPPAGKAHGNGHG